MAANDGPDYKGSTKPRDAVLVERLLNHAGSRAINVAALHAASVTQSESARVNGDLMEDFNHVLNGNCVCLNNFVCPKGDKSLFEKLKDDLVAISGDSLKTTDVRSHSDVDKENASEADGAKTTEGSRGLLDWSKHEVYENPTTISPTFNAIVEMLDHYFDVEIYATRLNYYRDGQAWKPFHHDSHAYGGRKLREDFTVGISLGQERALEFLHEPSGKLFSFPQENGDCFAFTNEVNTRFKHGVPKHKDPNCGDRFSIICWGRRRTVNERNGGGTKANAALAKKHVGTVDDAVEAAYDLVTAPARGGMGSRSQTVESADSAGSVPAAAQAKKKKKSRLQ